MKHGFMKTATTIPIDLARPRLTEILEIVRRGPVTITKDGAPVAVVLDPEDYESLVTTLEMQSNPELRSQLAAYERRRAAGEFEWLTEEDVERLARG